MVIAVHRGYNCSLSTCEYFQTPAEKSKLKCFLKPSKIPYLRGKEEVLNYDPRLSMFHDVISEGEMMDVKRLGEQKVVIST